MTTIIIDKNSELKQLTLLIQLGLATDEDMGVVDAREVFAIKSDTSLPRSAFIVTEKVAKVAGTRKRQFVASAERADRTGDVVRVAGWNFKDFKRNPVALWAHMNKSLPIGTVTDIDPNMDAKALFESIDFVDASLNPFAEMVLGLVDAKVLKGVSVGFLPMDVYIPKSEDERKQLGLGRFGVEHRKQAQVELSACSIPMHPDALNVRRELSKALGEMVRTKALTADKALALLDASEEPVMVGWTPAMETPSAEDKRVNTLCASLEVATKALATAIEGNNALMVRLERAEAAIASVKTVSVTTPGARAESSEEFFKALEQSILPAMNHKG